MRTIQFISTAIAVIILTSCGNYYRMVTTLDEKGNAIRDVYTEGDSAFMAGNRSNNPYLFDIDSSWKVTRFDSTIKHNFFGNEKHLNVQITKQVASIDLFTKEIAQGQYKGSLAIPEESLVKRFRWFYTNYTYTGMFKRLEYTVPIPIDQYLTKEEQKLWTQGNVGKYGMMNGSEMNDLLSRIEENFMNWYSHNCFEISLTCIQSLTSVQIAETDKEAIYKQLNELEADITPKRVSAALDKHYKTTRFTELYKANSEKLDQEFENSTAIVNQLSNTISYELTVPGEIVSTNSPIYDSNNLVWKVDGIRILFDDYTLTAEYRVVNLWAFIVSGLILFTAIISIILLWKRRNAA